MLTSWKRNRGGSIVKSLSLISLILFLIASIGCPSLWATNETMSSNANAKFKLKDYEPEKKKKIGVDQSDFMPVVNKFGFIGTYTISYNNLEQVKLKTNKHRLNLSGAYSFNEHWSAYGGIGVSHESYKMKIVRENRSEPFYKISNFNLGMVYRKNEPLNFVRRSSSTFNISLPISEQSRVDKHIANLSANYFMEGYRWKGLSLFNRVSTNYLWNTQRFSLFLDDQMNRDWLVWNSFGLTYMFLQKIGARFSYRADMERYLDGSWDLKFGNSLSLLANLSSFQVFLSMINNSYQENDRIDLGYYDRYRRVFMGGITYVF